MIRKADFFVSLGFSCMGVLPFTLLLLDPQEELKSAIYGILFSYGIGLYLWHRVPKLSNLFFLFLGLVVFTVFIFDFSDVLGFLFAMAIFFCWLFLIGVIVGYPVLLIIDGNKFERFFKFIVSVVTGFLSIYLIFPDFNSNYYYCVGSGIGLLIAIIFERLISAASQGG